MPAEGVAARFCLVTDRRRLARALGILPAAAVGALVDQILGGIAGGVDLVQIREPDLDADTLADLTRRILTACAASPARIVVNDRLDIALAAGAHGVHLREAGVPAARARALLPPGRLLGRSIHAEEGARRVAGVDYLIAGHVFETEAKPGASVPLGPAGLRRIVNAAGRVPVLAIGGVTLDTVGSLAETGATGIAAIGAYIPSGSVQDVSTAVQELAQDLQFRFDSHRYVP